jgi:hypothetical protein
MGLPEERLESAVRLSWGKEPLDKNALNHLISIVNEQQ